MMESGPAKVIREALTRTDDARPGTSRRSLALVGGVLFGLLALSWVLAFLR